MRRLLLLRHAKAVPHSAETDLERVLTKRGLDDALAMGEWIRSSGLIPDAAVVSHARRTRQTLSQVLEAVGKHVPVFLEPRLYHADPATLLEELHTAPDHVHTLLVVGHNPGISELAHYLTGSGEASQLAHLAQGFPTAALAVIDFEMNTWAQASPYAGRLKEYVTPATLAK